MSAEVMAIDPSLNGYKTEQAKAFYRRLQEGLDALPGVEAASMAVVRILDGDRWDRAARPSLART